MSAKRNFLPILWERLKSWEGFLILILGVVILINSQIAPNYLTVGNQINRSFYPSRR
jgi:hypothetical protein